MTKFFVYFEGSVQIEIDDEVLAAVDDDWRNHFYNLETVKEIVEFISLNVVIRGKPLSAIDGFADQPDEGVKVIDNYIEPTEVEEVTNDNPTD